MTVDLVESQIQITAMTFLDVNVAGSPLATF